MQLNRFIKSRRAEAGYDYFLQAAVLKTFSVKRQICSSFVLESLFPIKQITGVKIAPYAFIPHREAKTFL